MACRPFTEIRYPSADNGGSCPLSLSPSGPLLDSLFLFQLSHSHLSPLLLLFLRSTIGPTRASRSLRSRCSLPVMKRRSSAPRASSQRNITINDPFSRFSLTGTDPKGDRFLSVLSQHSSLCLHWFRSLTLLLVGFLFRILLRCLVARSRSFCPSLSLCLSRALFVTRSVWLVFLTLDAVRNLSPDRFTHHVHAHLSIS